MSNHLIFHGTKRENEDLDLDHIFKILEEKRDYLHGLSIEDLIDFFDSLIKSWQSSEIAKKYDIKNLAEFFGKENLSSSLNIAMRGDYHVLDKFVDLNDKKFMFLAQPRGFTVHWLAGNVPILGLFSIFVSLITKNVCLVKASSKGYESLIDFLETLQSVSTDKIDGAQIAECIAVILVDSRDTKTHTELSKKADVRVAWGGWEAINTIIGLEKSVYAEDLIFGPKYSYAAIDKESLAKDGNNIAQKLAVDVSVFDQYACSSPHTVFVQENLNGDALKFAKKLAGQLELVNRALIPKAETDPVKAAEIISLRGEYEFKGEIFQSKGTEWTVIFSEGDGLFKGCFSRVIMVKSITNLNKLADYNDRQKQTLGIAFTENNKEKYLKNITRKGIDRCPNFGYLTFYESPWDGMFVFDRLIRWVTVYK